MPMIRMRMVQEPGVPEQHSFDEMFVEGLSVGVFQRTVD